MIWRMGLLIAVSCGSFLIVGQKDVPSPFHRQRLAASDLEVSGMVTAIPHGESRFVSRDFLLSLPQVTVKIERHEDLPLVTREGVTVTGIYLDVLAKQLGALPESSAIEAICTDGYAAAFPAGYTRTHRPIFVLTVDGLSAHDWAVKNHTYDAGPYFVAYEHFVPAFQVLSHDERALEPDQLEKLLFSTKEELYGGIEPKVAAPIAFDSPVNSGYRIARQNCFRCHNAGEYGGTQAGKSWATLGKIAKERPEFFADWVRDPLAIDPQAKMPPNPAYDKATLTALTKYFETFAVEGKQ